MYVGMSKPMQVKKVWQEYTVLVMCKHSSVDHIGYVSKITSIRAYNSTYVQLLCLCSGAGTYVGL